MVNKSDNFFMPAIPDGVQPPSNVLPWQRWGSYGGISNPSSTFKTSDHLVLADNLDLLKILPDSFVDLAYIDPPFSTGVRRESPKGDTGPMGYEDSFESVEEFVEWISPRLRGLWRILNDRGSLVIHLDHRAVHYIRVWCDREFGVSHWENEIIWHYTGGGRSSKRFSRKHDVLIWYSKSRRRIFNIDAVREPYSPTSGYAKSGIVSKTGKKYLPHPDGTPVDDVWDIPIINPLANERAGYPTQKPLKLIERIVEALSEPDALVCDIFSGSGTTAHACRLHGRNFLCCDCNPDAVGVALERLYESDLYLKPTAVISNGFYRMSVHENADSNRIARRILSEGLRRNENSPVELFSPLWRNNGKANPPGPLSKIDMILRTRA